MDGHYFSVLAWYPEKIVHHCFPVLSHPSLLTFVSYLNCKGFRADLPFVHGLYQDMIYVVIIVYPTDVSGTSHVVMCTASSDSTV